MNGAMRSAASRDSLLTLRRVERQQRLIERLHAGPGRVTFAVLAREFGVAERTIARDIERLRYSGIPIDVMAGRAGGVVLDWRCPVAPIVLDLPEIAALISSLVALGPTATEPAASAMRKLTGALLPPTRATVAQP